MSGVIWTAARSSHWSPAREAWSDAGFTGTADADPALDAHRVAVVLGCGRGGPGTALSQAEVLDSKGARKISPFAVTMLMPNGPAAHVGLEIGARAGVHAVVSACASGAEAVGTRPQAITPGASWRTSLDRRVQRPAVAGVTARRRCGGPERGPVPKAR
ncbi:beta-ketoacyl synthase N-terminal-like domain-containing protein [Streptomyces sp. NPDC051567]|uniref:beta-ketoacyl synthase N-terminal-like domain-containing protein n=1 Tax=Streptomyces sp. NPDC051567 TaxID=3365660 RepID=UPI0037B229E2